VKINPFLFSRKKSALTVAAIAILVISYGVYCGWFAFAFDRSVIIPVGVTAIADGEFAGKQLTFVELPSEVTAIGNSAFSRNGLTGVNIPNSVSSIGANAFSGNQLTYVNIPNSVTSIGAGAFFGNRLTHVIIPNSVTSIGVNAFADNPVTSVLIGENVTLGGSQARQSQAEYDVLGQGTGFNSAYTNNRSRAGTYTRTNTDETRWTFAPLDAINSSRSSNNVLPTRSSSASSRRTN